MCSRAYEVLSYVCALAITLINEVYDFDQLGTIFFRLVSSKQLCQHTLSQLLKIYDPKVIMARMFLMHAHLRFK